MQLINPIITGSYAPQKIAGLLACYFLGSMPVCDGLLLLPPPLRLGCLEIKADGGVGGEFGDVAPLDGNPQGTYDRLAGVFCANGPDRLDVE